MTNFEPEFPRPLEADEPIIDIVGASRFFGEVQALNGMSLQVRKGAISVLLGPSDAGETAAPEAQGPSPQGTAT